MNNALLDRIASEVRDVPDFPKKGITFKDITPVLARGQLFRLAVNTLSDRHHAHNLDYVLGIDARGFIFAGAVAYKLGIGFIPVRKKGKLPYKTHAIDYELEYGTEVLEIHQDALRPGAKVLIVDDLLATGGTAAAAAELVTKLGAEVIEISFLIELEFLMGRRRLRNYKVFSALKY
ncbi:MAG: adenine phosphoribosyltransferase [Verrucomicrobiae bacterium]|nr:adenine phosphoribosyltransferase [Verrucomicrobiae bacterium]